MGGSATALAGPPNPFVSAYRRRKHLRQPACAMPPGGVAASLTGAGSLGLRPIRVIPAAAPPRRVLRPRGFGPPEAACACAWGRDSLVIFRG